jgi:hypothetical protein
MELLSKGDVQKRINAAIKKREPSFSEADIWKAIVHMTKGFYMVFDILQKIENTARAADRSS